MLLCAIVPIAAATDEWVGDQMNGGATPKSRKLDAKHCDRLPSNLIFKGVGKQKR
ncbi:MAG: hypothetical protein DSM106950_34935 [Stigonema ocellatum SAG 48.90 = DSM 106950]|nr:hypothetical protein [Stigonema ocellatum SAG 48.90 = DSM 106950]